MSGSEGDGGEGPRLRPGTIGARAAALLADPERRALLGTAPDAALAEAWGVPERAVRAARYQVGRHFSRGPVPRRVPPRPVKARVPLRDDAAKMALLGTMPDVDLALRWGVSQTLVGQLRRERGIPCYPRRPGPKARPPGLFKDFLSGDEARTRRLGTATDAALAAEWGVNAVAVHRARLRRGIPRFDMSSVETDPALIAALGQEDDADLAARFGISRTRVTHLRRERGIPPCPAEDPAWAADAGKMTDNALAKKWGVPVSTISSYRYRKGIPRASRRKRRDPAPR